MKNPITPAGIEPATFRFVAQHLNHCATAVPPDIKDNWNFSADFLKILKFACKSYQFFHADGEADGRTDRQFFVIL